MNDNKRNPNEAESSGLADLPGIDLEAGLRVARHNHAVYRRLLAKFRDGWSGYRQAFDDARATDGETRLLAHNLKGVAANLGIVEVQRLAGELEALCSQSPPAASTDGHHQRLFEELERVLAGLRTLD